MRIVCAKIPANSTSQTHIASAVFMWEEVIEVAGKPVRKKVITSLSEAQELDVEETVGHTIMAKYPGVFQVVHYGESSKAATAPRNTMLKDEKTK